MIIQSDFIKWENEKISYVFFLFYLKSISFFVVVVVPLCWQWVNQLSNWAKIFAKDRSLLIFWNVLLFMRCQKGTKECEFRSFSFTSPRTSKQIKDYFRLSEEINKNKRKNVFLPSAYLQYSPLSLIDSDNKSRLQNSFFCNLFFCYRWWWSKVNIEKGKNFLSVADPWFGFNGKKFSVSSSFSVQA